MRQHIAALRMLIIFTMITGIAYPLAIMLIAQVPGLKSRADGSPIKVDGKVVGSKLIGQSFADQDGNPLPQYFQTRPSAGDYDPTTTGGSNLGPESIVDSPSKLSLLTQVCSRSLAIGKLDGVDGSRPFCTPDGVGAVLAVFWSRPGYRGHVTRVVSVNQTNGTPFVRTYKGVTVKLAKPGADYSTGRIVPIRGNAPAHPAVPADAVTASGSGVDPEISPAYAKIQEARVARTRGITVGQVEALVQRYTDGRDLGFIGEARVNVLQVNVALDTTYPG